jgi:RNA polymerase sigma-70 factor (ECF subfamily)
MFFFLFPQNSASREKKANVSHVNELVRRCQKGDAEAFDQLVGQFQNRVYNLCLWQLGDGDEASDAAQETLIRAWRSIQRFRGDSAFSTWLHRIAVNVTHDALARRKTAPTPFSGVYQSADEDGDDFANLAPDTADLPPEALAREERRTEVRRALAELAPNHRMVLVLFDMEGHSYEDVATMLDLPMGTVKSRLNRARVALREKLESCRELFDE